MAEGAAFDVRRLQVVVVHPRDQDGETLLRHIQRLGCAVKAMWPAPGAFDEPLDVLFYLLDDQSKRPLPWPPFNPPGAVVAVIGRQGPGILRRLDDCSPHAVVGKPIDPFGLLTTLVVARNNFRYERRLLSKISKLEETLRSIRKVERAKAILMKKKNIEEQEAYEYLRRQAMSKRVPIGTIAATIVDADEMLA